MDEDEGAGADIAGAGKVQSAFDHGALEQNRSGEWVIQPLPSPLRIDGFTLNDNTSPETTESSIQMAWLNPDIGGVVKIFRRVSPLVLQSMPSGFQAFVIPGADASTQDGWTLISTRENDRRSGRYIDRDIPAINDGLPKAERRSLHAAYSYKIEISGGDRAARSPVRSTRIRGINRPRIESIVGISDDEIHVKWRDNSQLASGFQVTYYEWETGANKRVVTMNGTTKQDLVISGLAPDTDHQVGVKAWDYHGQSDGEYDHTSTQPARDAEPEDKTFGLNLTRQDVFEGHVPYLGQFPTLGNLPSGTLRGVSLASTWPALFFVKPGKSTSDCDDPKAVVRLAPGSSLTAAEMSELFGSETPALPIIFVACAQLTPQLYNFIQIRIRYRT